MATATTTTVRVANPNTTVRLVKPGKGLGRKGQGKGKSQTPPPAQTAKTGKTDPADKPTETGGLRENHILVLKAVKALGGKMVKGSDVEKKLEKSNQLSRSQVRTALFRMWEQKMLSFHQEDPDNSRAEDIFALTAEGRKAIG